MTFHSSPALNTQHLITMTMIIIIILIIIIIIIINELFYAGAFVLTNRLGVKFDRVTGRKEPIKELRKDLSELEASKDKDISNFRHWERLERKYSIRVKRLNVVIEELKQRITAIAAKVRRYQGRLDRQFYRELDQEKERER